MDSLIQLKLKEIELSKYKIDDDLDQVNEYLNSISSNDLKSLETKFKNNNVEFNLFVKEIKQNFSGKIYLSSLLEKN